MTDLAGWSHVWPHRPGYWPLCDVFGCPRAARWEKCRDEPVGASPFYLCDDHHAGELA